MPQAAIIGAALNDASAHPYNLEVGGLDLIKAPGGSGLGVPLESIVVNENGPGNISSMSFAIDDPQGAVSISSPLLVTFKANDGAIPETIYFRGWIDATDNEPDFGGQGRRITVRCSGIEQLLDWAVVPQTYSGLPSTLFTKDAAIMAGTFQPLLQRIGTDAGSAMVVAPWTRSGSFNYPVGNLVRPAEPAWSIFSQTATWSAPGGTLRNAILDLAAHSYWSNSGTGASDFTGTQFLMTVDWWYGLRIWEDDFGLQPDDYTTLVVTDTYAGTNVAENLSWSQDYTSVTRGVYVIGNGNVDYGLISDGTGNVGRTILLTDSAASSDLLARGRARGALGEDAQSTRGTLRLGPFAPATTIHAGSLITVNDTAASLNTTFRIMEIEKTFLGDGRQTWIVTFGGLPRPRASKIMRRWTRNLN